MTFQKSFQYSMWLSWLVLLISVLSRLIRAPILISKLGLDAYGQWVAALGIITVSIAYEYAINSSLVVILSRGDLSLRSLVKSRYANHRTHRRALALVAAGIPLIFSLSYLAYYYFPSLADSTGESYLVVICTIGLSCGLYLSASWRLAGIESSGNVHASKTGKLIYELSGLTSFLVFIYLWPTIYSIAFSLLLQSVAYRLYASYYLYNHLNIERQRAADYVKFDTNQDKTACSDHEVSVWSLPLLKSIISLTKMQLGSLLYSYAPLILIPMFVGYGQLGSYSGMCQLLQLGPYVLTPIITAYLARLVLDIKSKKYHEYHGIAGICLTLIFFGYSVLLVWGEVILKIWLGDTVSIDLPVRSLLVLISAAEVAFMVLRQLAIASGNSAVFDVLSLRATFIFAILIGLVLILNSGGIISVGIAEILDVSFVAQLVGVIFGLVASLRLALGWNSVRPIAGSVMLFMLYTLITAYALTALADNSVAARAMVHAVGFSAVLALVIKLFGAQRLLSALYAIVGLRVLK